MLCYTIFVFPSFYIGHSTWQVFTTSMLPSRQGLGEAPLLVFTAGTSEGDVFAKGVAGVDIFDPPRRVARLGRTIRAMDFAAGGDLLVLSGEEGAKSKGQVHLLRQAKAEEEEWEVEALGEAPEGAIDMRWDWLRSNIIFLVKEEGGFSATECKLGKLSRIKEQ